MKLSKVGVVNGCQSLSTLYANRGDITKDLRALVKVVEVVSDSALADVITRRSNQQNAVTLRDQRSSDPIMRDLSQKVQDIFGEDFAVRTRAGEDLSASRVLDNTLAAQLLTAVYLGEPWNAVRRLRLFDQDFRRIFNRQVTAERLLLVDLIEEAVQGARVNLRPDLRASFASIKFSLAYLVAAVCKLSGPGERLVNQPQDWLPGREKEILAGLRAIADEVVESVNFFISNELDEDADFDPKVVFKSKSGVNRLVREVLRDARREARRPDSNYLFDVGPRPITTRKIARKPAAKKAPTTKATKMAPAKKAAAKKANQKAPAKTVTKKAAAKTVAKKAPAKTVTKKAAAKTVTKKAAAKKVTKATKKS